MQKESKHKRLIPEQTCFTVELTFKPNWQKGKLYDAEKQLLLAYSSEILQEIEVEEKRIIEEEQRAALEITDRHKQEVKS